MQVKTRRHQTTYCSSSPIAQQTNHEFCTSTLRTAQGIITLSWRYLWSISCDSKTTCEALDAWYIFASFQAQRAWCTAEELKWLQRDTADMTLVAVAFSLNAAAHDAVRNKLYWRHPHNFHVLSNQSYSTAFRRRDDVWLRWWRKLQTVFCHSTQKLPLCFTEQKLMRRYFAGMYILSNA